MVTRTILHVDMDAFYTSVEQRDNPRYRGLPVVVGADPKGGRGRGVVAAASYEARAFGVHSAMPIGRAYRACPHAIYLRGDMHKYSEVSGRIMELLASYTDWIEPLSIDEAFLDVSTICLPEKGRALALEIKENVRSREGLDASIGVAPNKFLAKIASDIDKPDGLVVVSPGEERAFLRELPVERIWGVGPKTASELHRVGFRRIADLWNVSSDDPRLATIGLAGRHGEHILALALGLDERPVVPHHEAKSIGHETTFEEDIDDLERVRKTLLSLSDAVAVRLRSYGVRGQTVTLKFRDQDFVTETRAQTLSEPTDDGSAIYETALVLLRRVETKGRRVRLLGVSLSNLRPPEDPRQLSLFRLESGAEAKAKSDKLSRARDALDARFGKGTVGRASLLPRSVK
jgi:DNA polymerase IV